MIYNIPIYRTKMDDEKNIQLMQIRHAKMDIKDLDNCYEYIDGLAKAFNLDDAAEEYIIIMGYDNMDNMKIFEAGHGSLTSSVNGYRNIITFLMLSGSQRFMMLHNHPNGNINHSEQDIIFTAMLMTIVKPLDIEMDCHIIVTKDKFNDITELEDDIYER